MARSRAKERVTFSSHGQRRGKCRVRRRAERVSRPARAKNRRRRVLVVITCSPRPMRAVQRAVPSRPTQRREWSEMRTPRLFLGVFALALILLLPLPACSGSDEQEGRASSERATDEQEGGASSGRTTAAPTPAGTAAPTRQKVFPTSTPQPTAGLPMGLPSPETDREALVALFNATGGPNWTRNDNWLSDVPISEWEQVTTDDNGRVTELELGGNLLSGGIPPELGNLENLTVLALLGNHLTGEIPPELGNLTNLTELWLSFNQLSGEIPPELGNLAHLQELYLHFNQLSGEIPPELGSLTSLTALGLASNQLSGEIPHWLGNLDYLTWLVLGENQLTRCVPSSLLGRLETGGSGLAGIRFCP